MMARPRKTAIPLAESPGAVIPLDFDSLHDLTGPVNHICSMVELILKKHAAALGEAEQLFGFVQSSALGLQKLVEGLKTYAQVIGTPTCRRPCDMNAILAAALVSAQRAVESSGAILVHDRLPTVSCDFAQMAYVFGALIDNSIKFRGSRPPEIRVAAAPHPTGWTFSVTDNGMGINPIYKKRVFAVFKRLQRDTYPGSGVGLAIVKRVVELHGGRVWFESALGQGATFYLSLPDEITRQPDSAPPGGDGL